MTAMQLLGLALIASPFVGAFVLGWFLMGFRAVLGCFLASGAIIAIIFAGTNLLKAG